MDLDYGYHICATGGSLPYGDECAACQVWHDRMCTDGFDGWLDRTLLYAISHHPKQEFTAGAIREFSAILVESGADEPRFLWIVRLAAEPELKRPARWAAIRGWHDYTGWDCRSGLLAEFYATEADAFRTLIDWEREALQEATSTWGTAPAPRGLTESPDAIAGVGRVG